MCPSLDVESARKAFPALQNGRQIYLDNAGGSQILGSASGRIKEYLETCNVQLGASYSVAEESTSIYDKGLSAAASFINASTNEIGIAADIEIDLFKSPLSLTFS